MTVINIIFISFMCLNLFLIKLFIAVYSSLNISNIEFCYRQRLIVILLTCIFHPVVNIFDH